LSDLITVDEAARIVGVHRDTVYGYIRDEVFPGVRRLGRARRAIRIYKPDLIRWMAGDECTTKTRRSMAR
jgi:excisionase family DNA binding protein